MLFVGVAIRRSYSLPSTQEILSDEDCLAQPVICNPPSDSNSDPEGRLSFSASGRVPIWSRLAAKRTAETMQGIDCKQHCNAK